VWGGRVDGRRSLFQAGFQAIDDAFELGVATDRVQVRLASTRAAKDLRVNYREQLATTGTTAPVVTPRQVVALKAASRPTVRLGDAAPSLPRNLDASLDSYLSQGDFYGPRTSLGTPALSAV